MLPAFFAVGIAVLLGFAAFTLLVDYCFHWLNWISFLDLPSFDEMVDFFKNKDMRGLWWEGTIWFVLCNGCAWNYGLHAAASVAPSHKIAVAKVIFWAALILAVVTDILMVAVHVEHTFSWWYRNTLNDGTACFGMGFAIQQLRTKK